VAKKCLTLFASIDIIILHLPMFESEGLPRGEEAGVAMCEGNMKFVSARLSVERVRKEGRGAGRPGAQMLEADPSTTRVG
jgi:hypothetical protein